MPSFFVQFLTHKKCPPVCLNIAKKSVHAIRYDCSEAVRPHCHQLQGIGLCRRSTFVLHVLKMCKTSIQLQIYLTNEMLKKSIVPMRETI